MDCHSPETIQKWLARIRGHEGGYWDDPVGGPTKFGISQRSYPGIDIKSLTLEDAAGIFKRDFLTPIQADRFEDGVAYQLLDFAVNSGQTGAVKVLQRAFGLVADGRIGPRTVAALHSKSEAALVMIIISARLKFMVRLKNFPENAGGWTNRMADNLLFAVEDIC